MALFNYATRELSAKIVYYGPGLSGKTTNIEMVHRLLKPDQKGRLISLPTETDRTLFFDFLPVDLGQIKGFKVRFHLYTVPGQVFYNATRRLVLQGVDGVVFVADSQVEMARSNEESLKNLVENLSTYGKKLEDLPFVMQYNKRDLKQISSVEEMNSRLNTMKVPVYGGVAKDGIGVSETLVAISRKVFSHLRKTLLLPGEADEHEEMGEMADDRIEKTFRPPDADQFEEISDIEEIPEISETGSLTGEPVAVPAPVEEPPAQAMEPAALGTEPVVPSAEPSFPSIEPSTPAVEPPVSPVDSPPPGVESPPSAAEPTVAAEGTTAPEGVEILPGNPPAVEAPTVAGSSLVEEFEIEIPERAPAAPAPASAAGVSVEVESGGLTFLKFDTPFVAREGHAVLPVVFMDAAGNIVRMKIRITMEDQA